MLLVGIFFHHFSVQITLVVLANRIFFTWLTYQDTNWTLEEKNEMESYVNNKSILPGWLFHQSLLIILHWRLSFCTNHQLLHIFSITDIQVHVLPPCEPINYLKAKSEIIVAFFLISFVYCAVYRIAIQNVLNKWTNKHILMSKDGYLI